jgi:hypothetical protein
MPKTALLAVTALVTVLVAAPGAAHASSQQTMTFEAPRDLMDPSTRTQALNEIGALGVRSVRVVLYWHSVAPAADSRVKPKFDDTDPTAYSWGEYEPLIQAIHDRGWKLLLTVSGPVPRWATNGAKDTVTRPSPAMFGQFVTAVGRKFGAVVDRFSIWNEPNQPQFLQPQFDARHRATSPMIYRSLFLAAQRGLRSAGMPNKPILLGETSPRGTGKVVAPLTFLRGTLCLDDRYHRTSKSCHKLNVAGYAHHAYTTREGPLFKPPGANDVTIGVLSRLTTTLDRAARAGMLPAKLPISLTEFGIQSVPDPLIGVSLSMQNEYRSIAERIAYENPRVTAFSQYLLRDDLPDAPSGKYGGFESGLRTSGGKDKPSLQGFRLPLAAKRSGSGVSLWGLVRPATGATTVRVQFSDGKAFRTLANVRTSARGTWAKRSAYRSTRRWRVQWTAPDGATFTSPPVGAYR